jgi:hypothetical protein
MAEFVNGNGDSQHDDESQNGRNQLFSPGPRFPGFMPDSSLKRLPGNNASNDSPAQCIYEKSCPSSDFRREAAGS